MEPRVTTSFIPKQTIAAAQPRRTAGSPIGLLSVIATIIFLIVLVAAAGSFLLEHYTIQSIDSKRLSLEKSRSAFEPAIIKELSRLDTRITDANTLLKNHVASSRLFSYLEQNTLADVRFRNFEYTSDGPGRVTLSMQGEAKSYSAVALQSDAFGKSDILKDPIFSDPNLDAAGNVTFNFTAVVNTMALGYEPTAALSTTDL